jgi:hypothetical protein
VIRVFRSITIAAVLFCCCSGMVFAQADSGVKVTIERNTGSAATAAFKFNKVPSPIKDDAGAKAKLALVVGRRDGNGAELSALTDGLLPAGEDEPTANFFFSAGSDGGRIRMDFGEAIEIKQVNTYSWHSDSRAPQVYNLYASDGSDANFNPSPNSRTHPASCGWKLIATVDTRKNGESGGQYGASVSTSDASGVLGKYRYLLFDAVETEDDDPFGNTFFSEIDVIAK